MIQISEIVNKLIVNLGLEINPLKLGVGILGSYWEKIETPSEDGNLGNIDHIGSKHTGSVSLRKLDILIVQVLCGAKRV